VPSNVALVALAVAERDRAGIEQSLFYNKGVGTGMDLRYLGGAFGLGLSTHIKDCYLFLVDNWEPGDEIFLFGFSRGAYTARSLAGLVRNSGILRPRHRSRVSDAFDLYRRRDDPSAPNGTEAELFRRMYSEVARIKLIGVWDTVGALGIPNGIPWLPVTWLQFLNRKWQFHDVKLSSYVDNAFQALAVDERRPQFSATLWEQQEHSEGQLMEQVWFAGTHSNVGGGYADRGLSDLALSWMKTKAEATGLAFDDAKLPGGLNPNPTGELRESKEGIYAKFPDAIRPIGEKANGNEALAPSVLERMQNLPTYRPPNVERYVERRGPPTPP